MSAVDVAAVRKSKTRRGYCLDAPAQYGGQWGHQLQIWSCNGQPQQIRDLGNFHSWTFTYSYQIERTGLCLDNYGYDNWNSAPVVTWGCNGGWNQQWERHW